MTVWEAACANAIGGRSEQQDRVAVWRDPAAGAVLAVVADGMGGHEGGALAAQCVVDVAGELWQRAPRPLGKPLDLLAEVCRRAHERINQKGQGSAKKPGSTCVVFYGDDRRTAWAHVGDSRIYHFRDGALVGRSRDHSMVQLLVDQGEISEAQMATHPDQNLILQSLGGERDPRPDFDELPLAPGDSFLLCTDGLWEAIASDEMSKALLQHPLSTVAETLVTTAAQRRGTRSDNVAVALVRAAGSVEGKARARTRWTSAVVWLLVGSLLGVAATWLAVHAVRLWRSTPPVVIQPPPKETHEPPPAPAVRPPEPVVPAPETKEPVVVPPPPKPSRRPLERLPGRTQPAPAERPAAAEPKGDTLSPAAPSGIERPADAKGIGPAPSGVEPKPAPPQAGDATSVAPSTSATPKSPAPSER